MKIVLDTNVILTIISSRSPFRWAFDAFLDEKYTLCVTTDILLEYAEIVERYMGNVASNSLMQVLEQAENVEFVTRYYKWNLSFRLTLTITSLLIAP